MRIDLSGSQALMSQQFLYTVEFSTAVEHHAGKGVTQHVGAEFAGAARRHQRIVHDMIDERGVQGLALVGNQQVIDSGRHLGTQRAVVVQRRRQLVAEGDDAVLVALAAHLELVLGGSDRC